MKIRYATLTLFFAASAFAETVYNKEISTVQYNASYSGGPARGVYVYLTDGTSYRYLLEASGNTPEHGRALMSVLLSAQAMGRHVNIGCTSVDPDGNGPDHGTFYAVTVR